ncbi:unnamed protein product, partial [Scytosiphon promiscuus]
MERQRSADARFRIGHGTCGRSSRRGIVSLRSMHEFLDFAAFSDLSAPTQSRTTACCLRTQPICSILHATIYVQRSVFIHPSWAALAFSVRASLLSLSFSDVVAPPFGPSSLTLSVELPLDPGFNRSASACASI